MLHTIVPALTVPFELLRAAATVLRSFRLLRWCILPWLLGFVAFFVAARFLSYYLTDAALVVCGIDLAPYLGAVGAVLGAALTALLVTIISGSLFFDFLVEEALNRFGAPLHPSHSVRHRLQRLARGLLGDVGVVCILGVVGLITLITSVIPPLAIVSAGLGVLLLGFEILDKPLSILEIQFRRRLTIARAHGAEGVAFGAIKAVVIAIPFANIIVLPIFYVAAAARVARWLQSGAEGAAYNAPNKNYRPFFGESPRP